MGKYLCSAVIFSHTFFKQWHFQYLNNHILRHERLSTLRVFTTHPNGQNKVGRFTDIIPQSPIHSPLSLSSAAHKSRRLLVKLAFRKITICFSTPNKVPLSYKFTLLVGQRHQMKMGIEFVSNFNNFYKFWKRSGSMLLESMSCMSVWIWSGSNNATMP